MTFRRLRGVALPAVLALSWAVLQGCAPGQRYRPGNSGSSGGSARLDVQNDSGQTIRSVQASSCSDTNWGPNRLESRTVSAGGAMSFDLTPGCWDFRADFDSDHSSGNELVQRNIQINGGSSWAWAIGG